MSRNERLARELHKMSDHGQDGGEFDHWMCNCERMVNRLHDAGWVDGRSFLMRRYWYTGVMIGAWLTMWFAATGHPTTWRTPLIWAALWTVYELIAWGIRVAWRRHKSRVRK